jgi:uncharacterized protein
MSKPAEIKARDAEWDALVDFANAKNPAGAVGLLYGRRRTGKSYLLRHLVRSVGGLYVQATEAERPDSLLEFGQAVAQLDTNQTGRAPEPISYQNWADALGRRTGLVVLDEFPYLLNHSPELPSLIQRIVDEAANGERDPIRFILCGSSLSVMSTLLQGQQPLRGRATLDLLLRPMDHADTAKLWDIPDFDLALRLHAILGGAPGYRALTTGLPKSAADLGSWFGKNVLNPTHALYREDDYLLQEERTITDRALYGSILRLIASGVASQSEMAGRLARSRESLNHPLTTLVRSGFVIRDVDLLKDNKPQFRLADPIIRFLRLVVEPARALLDEGRWSEVWMRAEHRLDANVYGPHLESIARRWAALRYEPVGGSFVSEVGSTRVADPVSKKSIEIDLVVLGQSDIQSQSIVLLGETKWSHDQFGSLPLERLGRARDLLGQQGCDVSQCQLALISRTEPTHAGEGLRVGLDTLYA